jgi:hypothetical protein
MNGCRRRGCNRRERNEAMADYRGYIVGEDGISSIAKRASAPMIAPQLGGQSSQLPAV